MKKQKYKQEKYKQENINFKPQNMWTNEDYENAIPKEIRDAYDKAQEQINKIYN